MLTILLLFAHDKRSNCKLSYSITILRALLILIMYFLFNPNSTVSLSLFSFTSSVYSLKRLSTLAHSCLASMIVIKSDKGSGFLISLSLLIGFTSLSSLISYICSSRVLKWLTLWRVQPYLFFYHLCDYFSKINKINIRYSGAWLLILLTSPGER